MDLFNEHRIWELETKLLKQIAELEERIEELEEKLEKAADKESGLSRL